MVVIFTHPVCLTSAVILWKCRWQHKVRVKISVGSSITHLSSFIVYTSHVKGSLENTINVEMLKRHAYMKVLWYIFLKILTFTKYLYNLWSYSWCTVRSKDARMSLHFVLCVLYNLKHLENHEVHSEWEILRNYKFSTCCIIKFL